MQEGLQKKYCFFSSRGLRLFDIPSDGDCLYAGIAHQLRSMPGGGEMSVQNLRDAAADVMNGSADDYLPFLTDPKTGDMMSQDGFAKYGIWLLLNLVSFT